jgi:hypothetical protein
MAAVPAKPVVTAPPPAAKPGPRLAPPALRREVRANLPLDDGLVLR